MITFYDNKGKIILSARCSADAKAVFIADPTNQSYSYLDVEYDPEQYYIDTVTLQPIEIPPKPSPDYIFSYNTHSWQIDTNIAAQRAKNIRGQLLKETDWTDTLSSKNRLGEDLYNQWQAYRQALRDVPEQAGFPLSIIWPTPPA